MLQVGDVAADARQLVRPLLLLLRRGDLLLDEADLVPGERVALREHLVGDRLLARLERPQPRRLGGDRPARRADPVDDRDRLLANPGRERDSLKQVTEPPRLEHHADDVRPVALVVADQLAGQHRLGAGLERLEVRATGSSRRSAACAA